MVRIEEIRDDGNAPIFYGEKGFEDIKKKYAPQHVLGWIPLPEEFEKWKEYNGSDIESRNELLSLIKTQENKMGLKMTLIEVSVEDFARRMKELNLANNSDGRSKCIMAIGAEREL